MAVAPQSSETTAKPGRTGRRGGLGWLVGLFGSREIEQRVDENFPSWQEFSEEKMRAAHEQREERQFELPPHHVYVSSPLGKNVLYLALVSGALAMGLTIPEQAPYLIYGAIVLAAVIAVFVIFRDGLFFHLEGGRLRADGEMINRHTKGPGKDKDPEKSGGFLKSFGRHKKKPVFRSKLLQIHYQNILRTFEQGNRRAWVYQDASITDIETLLSQRGMKLAWTLIEVLPQMGLIGTLIGLSTMFFAFRASSELPELSIVSGFGTALGTTILANLFVLILRPLHMQNERSMAEILSNLQMLMAMFILPTQQDVFDRGTVASQPQHSPHAYQRLPADFNEARLSRTLEDLSHALTTFTEQQQELDSGNVARETAQVAHEVRSILSAFGDSMQTRHVAQQDQTATQLARAMRDLTESLTHLQTAQVRKDAGSERIEHDLAQLRLLTHDTLLLMEQIAGQMEKLGEARPELLSSREKLRAAVLDAGLRKRRPAGEADRPTRAPTPAETPREPAVEPEARVATEAGDAGPETQAPAEPEVQPEVQAEPEAEPVTAGGAVPQKAAAGGSRPKIRLFDEYR